MASNIVTAKVAIRGVRPLLWCAFTENTIPADGKKERTGVAGNDPIEWTRTYLADKNGRLYIEPSYVFGCIRDGAKHIKKGRGSIQALVAATLQVTDDRVYTDRVMPEGEPPKDPEAPVYIDVRSVRNPATKARNVRYRVAASAGWETSFNILWDRTVVSRQEMEAAIIDAGRLCGLGDGRSIGFGRFEVVNFEVAEG